MNTAFHLVLAFLVIFGCSYISVMASERMHKATSDWKRGLHLAVAGLAMVLSLVVSFLLMIPDIA